MSLHPQTIAPVPEETARVAHAVLPQGKTYMRMRDHLGTLYQDQDFADLFPPQGQPAEAPWRLYAATLNLRNHHSGLCLLPDARQHKAVPIPQLYAGSI